jgi:pimeloyl-ACP methyl ester carboxylesterase
MSRQRIAEDARAATDGNDARRRVLAGAPVTERRVELAGVSTALLESGEGPPVVLLHGQGGWSGMWLPVIGDLRTTHRVIAADLPGLGGSELPDGPPDAARVLAWLGELIERACPSPPVLVGQIVGGAIAARFAAGQSGRLAGLVLVDTLGLVQFQPAPEFERALMDFLSQPTDDTIDRLWARCAFDLDGLRERMGERWTALRAYALDRARSPAVQTALNELIEQFGFPAIAPAELARITVPTTLIWGRHDLATPLEAAESASARYGWPLYVIEGAGDDPAIEQPEAFVRALRAAGAGAC